MPKISFNRFIIAILIIIFIIILRLSGVGTYINLEFFRLHAEKFKLFIGTHYLLSVLVFFALYSLIVALTIPISPVLNIAAGYLFYVIPGALYSIGGASCGALISFLSVRYLFKESVQKKYGKYLMQFNKEFKERGASYLLFLQLLPITPFAAITIISGISDVTAITFLWTTIVGITPGAFIYSFAGKELMEIEKASDVLSGPVLAALLLLAFFALLPILMRYGQKIVDKNKQRNADV